MTSPADIGFIEKLVSQGRFLEARSKCKAQEGTDHIRLKQLYALAMARSGAARAAMDFLEPVYNQNPEDPETAGILGGIYKEIFRETRTPKYAVLSRDTYLRNFQRTGSYYTGINAAAMSMIAGSASRAREIANDVIANIDPATRDVWELATLAEAFLLTKEKERSTALYLQCRQQIGSDWGKIGSIYSQLWLLNHYIPVANQVLQSFSPPAIAAFVGHMIDHPSRSLPRFPNSSQHQAKEALRAAIRSLNVRIGYCSLANGGDILFAEAMTEEGGEVNLFLPFDQKDFEETSVTFAGERWLERFRALVAISSPKFITHEHYAGNDDLFTFQSRVILGSARHRAAQLHSKAHLISLFSNADIKTKEGGTRDTLDLWPAREGRLNIDPVNFLGKAEPQATSSGISTTSSAQTRDPSRRVRYVVSITFNESRPDLRDRFHFHLEKKIAEWKDISRAEHHHHTSLAFDTVTDAVSFAWSCRSFPGLPVGSIGVSLHAGPLTIDPHSNLFTGAITEYLRGMNEVSVPGKVYASFPFSFALALESDEFALDYAGIIAVEDAGDLEIYQVNRHAEAFEL